MESGSDVRKAWKCEDCEKIFKSETDRMPSASTAETDTALNARNLNLANIQAQAQPQVHKRT